jgi:hypothetical protein
VVLAQPDRIADRIRRSSSQSWKLGERAPGELASILRAAPSPAPDLIGPVQDRPEPPAMAADPGSVPPAAWGPPEPPPPSAPAFTPPPAATVYLVQTKLEGAALDSLRNALAPYGDPVFEESAGPLPLEHTGLNPDAVVWWGRPSGWTWWGTVPVVIDRER